MSVYPKQVNKAGINITILKQALSDRPETLYIILCPECNKPKQIYASQLKAGKGIRHRSCSAKLRTDLRKLNLSITENRQIILGYVFNTLKGRSKRKNLTMNLTKDDLIKLIFNNCNYCDGIPNLKYLQNPEHYNGLDRVNNNLGYLQENCVPCCAICNRAKSTMKVKDFIYWINNIKQKKEDLHITETRFPLQTKRFREILDEMYQTHLNKNADYSSWNVNATGLIGLVVRFWDKSARIMNLCGFDIGTGDFSGNKQNLVKDETIIDTFKDAGVYSIIARIWAEGKWGK